MALDTRCLVLWAREDPEDLDRQRFEHLVSEVAAAKGKIVIPTPVIAEFLVGTDEATADWISVLERRSAVEVAPFDIRAALECALIDRSAIAKGDKRGGRKADRPRA